MVLQNIHRVGSGAIPVQQSITSVSADLPPIVFLSDYASSTPSPLPGFLARASTYVPFSANGSFFRQLVAQHGGEQQRKNQR